MRPTDALPCCLRGMPVSLPKRCFHRVPVSVSVRAAADRAPYNTTAAAGSPSARQIADHEWPRCGAKKTYLAQIAVIVAVHLLDLAKAHLFVDGSVGHVARALQIALAALGISHVRDRFNQYFAHAPALGFGQHRDNVAKVVALRVRPEFRLRSRLRFFPYVVALPRASVFAVTMPFFLCHPLLPTKSLEYVTSTYHTH